jgi:hypothetical protein
MIVIHDKGNHRIRAYPPLMQSNVITLNIILLSWYILKVDLTLQSSFEKPQICLLEVIGGESTTFIEEVKFVYVDNDV